MYILEFCDNGTVLSVLRIVNIIMTIIRVVVPIILILSLMIGYMNAVKDNDSDALAKANKALPRKIIAAVLVFLIPNFVYVLIDIVDPGNRTYFSCLNYATDEHISEAYRITTENYIDIARESLKKSDYDIAEKSYLNVKGEEDAQELRDELDDLKKYVDLRERILNLADSFDKDEYAAIKADIAAITDEEMKEKLESIFGEAVGGSGSIESYDTNPSSEIYRNLKNFNGKTLKSVLEENGSSVEKLDAQIKAAVEEVGVGTRQAPVAAALTLIETLANYGYRINYDWGGKHYKLGIDGNMGKKITPLYCASHSNPDRCKTQLIWKGFDCSGFVNWAMIQGFDDEKHERLTCGEGISLVGKNEAVCDVGDVIQCKTHITLVVGHDDEKKSYIVAESGGGGVKLSYYSYNNSRYFCKHLSYPN